MVLCNHTLLGEESHDSEPGGEKRGEKRENDAKTQDNGVCGTCAVWLRTDVRKPLLCLARSVEIAWSRHLKACGKGGGAMALTSTENGSSGTRKPRRTPMLPRHGLDPMFYKDIESFRKAVANGSVDMEKACRSMAEYHWSLNHA